MTVNIFIVYSPLHYLAAENISENFCKGERNILYYLKPEFEQLVNTSRWNAVQILPWPRFYPNKGMFGRIVRTKENLEIVCQACSGADEIRLHTPVIDTEAINYLINYLQSKYPQACFSVRITPDGLLNMQRHPLGRFKESLQYLKKVRRVFCPTLNYYCFKGDRIGSDAAIVDKIYTLHGIPHEYDTSKTVTVSLCNRSQLLNDSEPTSKESRAKVLVVGQPLTGYKRLSPAELVGITAGIRSFIDTCGSADVYYKPHPRDEGHELRHPDYHELKFHEPLETYLANNYFDLVIGVCSTALLTARLLLPSTSRVVAYGLNQMKYRGIKEKKHLWATYESIGVEIVDHEGN